MQQSHNTSHFCGALWSNWIKGEIKFEINFTAQHSQRQQQNNNEENFALLLSHCSILNAELN